MKKVIPPASETFARIRVIGVGGSGKNATNHMIKIGIPAVEFIVANTDAQDLQGSRAEKRVHLGKRTTQGLGTGMDPTLGKSAAEESMQEINETIKGADLVFIACGMGGGTGTGAAPVIAKAAQDLGILTVGVVTKPFSFEGGTRRTIAKEGIAELAESTDAIMTIPNDLILATASDKTTMADAFALSDEVLFRAVSGIAQLITKPGDINIDFADIRAILEDSGIALLGLGSGRGINKAEIAVAKAISSPLLEVSIKGARRVLFSVASRSRTEISMREIQIVAERVTESVDPNAKIIFGTSTDRDLKQGQVQITLIATDFPGGDAEKSEETVVRVAAQQPQQSVPARQAPRTVEHLDQYDIGGEPLESEVLESAKTGDTDTDNASDDTSRWRLWGK